MVGNYRLAEYEYLYPSDRKYNQEEVDELENEIDKLQERIYILESENEELKAVLEMRIKHDQ